MSYVILTDPDDTDSKEQLGEAESHIEAVMYAKKMGWTSIRVADIDTGESYSYKPFNLI
jgi:hypothetical protein